MIKRLRIEEMDANFITFFEQIKQEGDPYLLELHGEPILTINPVTEQTREELFKVFDRVHSRNREARVEQVENDVDEAVRFIRSR